MSPEEKLVEYSRLGDTTRLDSLFERLYQDYSGLVGFVVAKYLSSPDLIKDIINESFLRLFENREKVKNIKYFLLTTAKNLAINEARRQSRYVALDDSLDEGYDPGVDSSAEYALTIEKLKKILVKEDLTLVLDHILYDKTFGEIAKETGQKEASVRTRYNRALKKIRKEGLGR